MSLNNNRRLYTNDVSRCARFHTTDVLRCFRGLGLFLLPLFKIWCQEDFAINNFPDRAYGHHDPQQGYYDRRNLISN